MSNWYARPVLFVEEVGRSVDFYVDQLGSTRSGGYEEEGTEFVAQVERWTWKSCRRFVPSWKPGASQ